MAKGYSFIDISRPTSPSASAVAGGSLTASTTYYYRVMKVSASANANYFNGKSQMSDQFSVTTDNTNKTARITFTCPYITNQSYRIWRSTSSTAIGTTYLGHIAFYPTDNIYNSSGTVTFDDNGSYTLAGNNFAEINDQAHGILSLSGSVVGDQFSIVDLYNADVSNGWGVIIKLDINTYKVNCLLDGHSVMYWTDSNKVIIFADGVGFWSNSTFNFGLISGSDRTYAGCEIIVTSNWLTTFSFGTLTAYRTIFKYISPPIMGNIGLGLTSANVSSGTVTNCQVDNFRGFIPSASCTYNNLIMSRFDNAFDGSSATFNNVKMLSGSRIWQIAGGNTNVVGRGIFSSGTYAVLVSGSNSTSSLSTINSIIDISIFVNSSSTGFRWYDKFSYNITAVDVSGTGINTPNIKVYDKDSTLLFNVNGNSSGVIAEQIITRKYNEVSGMSVLSDNVRGPFTVVVSKAGYQSYTEVFTPSSSIDITKSVVLKLTTISFSGLSAGSTVQIYDVKTSAELYKNTVAGTTLSYTYSGAVGDSIRIRIRKAGYIPYETTGTISDTGIALIVNQTVDTIYVANAIDGSTVTEFSLTEGVTGIFLNTPSNITTGQRIYNGYMYQISTTTFIDDQAYLMTAQTSWSYVLDNSLLLKNTTANTLYINGSNINNIAQTGAVINTTGGTININGYFPFNSSADVGTAVWEKQTSTMTTTGSAGEKVASKLSTKNDVQVLY